MEQTKMVDFLIYSVIALIIMLIAAVLLLGYFYRCHTPDNEEDFVSVTNSKVEPNYFKFRVYWVDSQGREQAHLFDIPREDELLLRSYMSALSDRYEHKERVKG